MKSSYTIESSKYFRSPRNAYVEGDASSASYFLACAAVTCGTVTIEGCGTSSLQVNHKCQYLDVCKLLNSLAYSRES